MATTTSLRVRRSAAQLHALAGVEREIRANDPNSRRKYLRDFSDAFPSYQSVMSHEEVHSLVDAADIVLIGDYHALPASQHFAAGLFEERAHANERPVVLGVEAIFSRDQHILDAWWRREIDEAELRQRIRFDLDWGYDWGPFYQVLLTAREHGEAIYALDCMPREDLRKIGARDRHAAHKLAEIRQRHPGAAIMVLFGESHLAPGHLPRRIKEQMPQERLLTVLQNVDGLYWRAAGEQRGVEAVKVSDEVICAFNATPLEKCESYRLYMARWRQEESEALDLCPTIYNLIDGLMRFLGIELYSAHNTTQPKFLVDALPEVNSEASDAQLRDTLLRLGWGESEIEPWLRRLEERGCAYLAETNVFFVREFQMMYAAEEAARFLHQGCQGLPLRGSKKVTGDAGDSFYRRTVELALGYLGSRVLNPARPAGADDCEYSHAACQRYAEQASRMDASCAESMAERLGYTLGEVLYESYLAGQVMRAGLRKFFLSHLQDAEKAREVCFELSTVARLGRAKARAAGLGN